MHGGCDGLATQGDENTGYRFPKWIGTVHGNRPLNLADRNGDRLADCERHLPYRQHYADHKDREKNAEH